MGTAPDPLWGHSQIARLAGAAQRVRRADRDRPWVLDIALVAVLLLLCAVPDLLHDIRDRQAPLPEIAVLQLALALPLLIRRRAPATVLAVVGAVFVVQWSVNVWLHLDVALFLALYSVARHGKPRYLPWAYGAVAAMLLLPALRVPTPVSWVVVVFFLYSAATAAAALGLAVRIGLAHLEALREHAARLEVERDQRVQLAAAAERARVAREMHDIIGHNLSVIIGLADGGSYAGRTAPERSRQALEHIAATGRQALDELRRMLGVLKTRPDGDDPGEGPRLRPQPGIADLDALCEGVRAAGPEVRFSTAGDPGALDRGVQLTLYRIAQESLTNTLKHAGPHTRARLTLTVDRTHARVRVEDTGPATPRPPGPVGEGHGLAGMRERAALYGGTVTAGPRPGGGWTVDAVLDPVPLPDTGGPS
ncbi:histidine kinase [Streptomyces sp. SL13]|uniref:histidine kinase n=1 Tax=Streptantibioticus silvisoli TaxID=2705255 RepID=A0AA90JXB4_9ACTN|nr:histidine kinase [Streptantibioticus silvisoli]MDI5969971.1 histidine kinase [Streptantibioticus silvisoli]